MAERVEETSEGHKDSNLSDDDCEGKQREEDCSEGDEVAASPAVPQPLHVIKGFELVVVEDSGLDPPGGRVHVEENVLDFEGGDGDLIPAAVEAVEFQRKFLNLFVQFDDFGRAQVRHVPAPLVQVLLGHQLQDFKCFDALSIPLLLP